MTEKRLTIAIPTYNRNELLNKNLPCLLRQNRQDVDMLILDNASLTPVRETLGDVPPNIRVVRNRANVGGNANILKCFELCETEWIWILGDDDQVQEGAINQVLSDLSQRTDYVSLNYSTAGCFQRKQNIETVGCLDFLSRLDDFGNVLFISSNVYRVSLFRQYLDIGYHYAYSCGPHVAMTLMALGKEGKAFFSKDALILWQRPTVENRGSILSIARGIPVLQHLPLEDNERKKLLGHLSRFPRPAALAHQLLLLTLFGGCSIRTVVRMNREVAAQIPFFISPKRRLERAFWSFMLCVPRLTWLWVRPLYKRFTGHETGPQKLQLSRL